MLPYTYYVKWSKLDIGYYGVRYAKNCHPSDLFITYFTSSKYVREFISLHGLPDIIQIRKTFISPEKAKIWESKLLYKCKATTNPKLLNKSGSSKLLPTYSEQRNQKISNSLKLFYSDKNNRLKHKERCNTQTFKDCARLNNLKSLITRRNKPKQKKMYNDITIIRNGIFKVIKHNQLYPYKKYGWELVGSEGIEPSRLD